ncbi:MAG: glycerophosphodiester phosphodiesterase family protein [Bacteroidetes bacterium]|nr:glycerophosphodiester phosphodiesterase family protein [Bacteroidota bacterium]
MKIRILFMTGLLLLLFGCNKDTVVPVPSAGPNSILKDTYPLKQASKLLMEGVYRVTSGADEFGDYMILKWNRTSLSFANNNGKHFIMDAGSLDSVIFIQGYWRDGYSDATGLCTMYISKSEGGTSIVTASGSQQIILRGGYGNNTDLPGKVLTLEYLRPFSSKVKNSNFYILAHRAGGRTSDRLPVSENSIEMINFTEKLGTTGVEIDVRLSSDKVAFIYHDADINTRLTQKGPLAGPISDYSWLQISTMVRLIHGERIPKLESALNFVVDSTLLRFVYLDMKESGEAMSVVIPIQKRILQRAHDKGRDLIVVVGIPSDAVLQDLKNYPDYQDIPSLCELTVDDVQTLNSKVWGPRWTLGTQNDLVQQMHNEGRLAVCWTIDNPEWIATFIRDGLFDGLLTNFPYVEAYYHYIQE